MAVNKCFVFSTIDCSIDIAFGFDISHRPTTQPLVSGHPKLQQFLPEIVQYVSTLQGLCCVGATTAAANIAYSAWGRDGRTLHNFHFEGYSEEVVKKVMAWQMSEATYFNTDLLHHFRDKFRTESNAGVKVSWKNAEMNLAPQHTSTTVDTLANLPFYGSEVNVPRRFICV